MSGMGDERLDGKESAASYASKMTDAPCFLWQLMGCNKQTIESGIYQRMEVPPAAEHRLSADGLMAALDQLPEFTVEDFLNAHRDVFVKKVSDYLEEVYVDKDNLFSAAEDLPEDQSPFTRQYAFVNLGGGEATYLVAKDIPEEARDALSALVHLELAEMALAEWEECLEQGDDSGAVKYETRCFLALFSLGGICQRIQVRPFEALVDEGKKSKASKSRGGKASADISEEQWPVVEEYIDKQLSKRFGKKKVGIVEACKRASRILVRGELLPDKISTSHDGLRKRYNKSKKEQQESSGESSLVSDSRDASSLPPKLPKQSSPTEDHSVAQSRVTVKRRNPKKSLGTEYPDSKEVQD